MRGDSFAPLTSRARATGAPTEPNAAMTGIDSTGHARRCRFVPDIGGHSFWRIFVDPKHHLVQASACLHGKDATGCLDHLKQYNLLRRRGGFEPVLQEHELTVVVPVPEGGIQGDLLARHLRLESQYACSGGQS